MKDLVAVVTVRRLLLELGYVLQPEALAPHIGPLSMWIAEPRPDLDGMTPMAALLEPDGEERIRACLSRLISTLRQPPSIDSPAPEA
jgi:hypothetical protein